MSANPLPKLKRRKPDREKGERGSDEIVRYLTPEQHLPSFVKYNSIYQNVRRFIFNQFNWSNSFFDSQLSFLPVVKELA